MARQANTSAKEVPAQQELMTFVTQIEARLEVIETAYREQQWRQFCQQETPTLDYLEKERADLLLNEEAWITVMRWVGALSPTHPAQRRMVLLGRQLIPASVESQLDVYTIRNEITGEYLKTLPVLGGQSIPWSQVLRIMLTDSSRSAREATFKAMSALASHFRARFLELVQRRNYWAKKQGYDNYIDLALAPQGLSRDSVLERYVEIEEATAAPYRSFVARMQHHLRLDRIAPWDLLYLPHARLASPDGQPGFSGARNDIFALIKDLGLPWDTLNIQITAKDNLPFLSLCWPIRIPDNIQLILPQQSGWEAYIETARACGQALLYALNRQPTFLFKHESPAFAEGMGTFLARLAAEPVWLRKRRLMPESRLQRMTQIALDLLVLRLRRLMALSVFEYHIYENPKGDLDALWGRVQEAFLSLPNEPWDGWAAQPEYILRPIHIQNEIIGEIIASQAIGYLYQRFGYLLENPELTQFLEQTFYSSGAAEDWVDKVRTATGKFLSNKALFGELVGEE